MKQQRQSWILVLALAATAGTVWATNGDNLIGVGPVSRAMGGTGVAAPQDAIGGMVNNPATLGVLPAGAKTEADFGGTLFIPTVRAKITTPGGVLEGKSQQQPFVIPAVGIAAPINDRLNFGFAAYGISGMGVDYRNMHWDLDGNPGNGYEGDMFTKLEVMKFSPILAYKLTEDLALGLALQGNYNNLDLGAGSSHDYSYGAQVGLSYKVGIAQLGASYTTPQKCRFQRVFNFDAFMGDNTSDTLELEAPATYAVGIALVPNQTFMIEADVKYVAWSQAAGYSDFDWQDQVVASIGAQVKPLDKLALRAGVNFGKNPVKEHDGWNPQGVTTVQGKQLPTFGYEMMRNIGFPAIVQTHVTLGLGYQISKAVSVNLEYMHAFKQDISSTSMGNAITLESSLEEDSLGFSLNWQFE